MPGSTDSLKRRSWIPPSSNAEINAEPEKSSNSPMNNSSASSSSLSKSYDKLDSLSSSPKIGDISSTFIENESKYNIKNKSQTLKEDIKESSRGLFANKLRKFKKGEKLV